MTLDDRIERILKMGIADRPGSMPDDALLRRIDMELEQLRGELYKAMTKHAPMNSPHEGHSVIREEFEELWDHVKADTGRTTAARKEARQVAAMGLRYVLDLCQDVEKYDDLQRREQAKERDRLQKSFDDALARAGKEEPAFGHLDHECVPGN